MTKAFPTFRKVDVKRAIEAVMAGGIAIGRVEIEAGKIVVVSATEETTAQNPLDEWLRNNART